MEDLEEEFWRKVTDYYYTDIMLQSDGAWAASKRETRKVIHGVRDKHG